MGEETAVFVLTDIRSGVAYYDRDLTRAVEVVNLRRTKTYKIKQNCIHCQLKTGTEFNDCHAQKIPKSMVTEIGRAHV